MLLDMGIVSVKPRGKSWKIVRTWYKNNSKTIKQTTTLKIFLLKGKAKYVKPKEYLKVSFNWKGKHYDFPLHRFIWAWFYDKVPDGYEIDHINNDPFDNRLDNLQLLTTYENRKKRWSNPNNAKNQWEFMDDLERGIDKYRRFCKRQRKKMEW